MDKTAPKEGKNVEKLEDRTVQTYAAVGVALVYFLVGVPLWWKTTDVYRVQLPYSDIELFSNKPLVITVGVTVVILDNAVSEKNVPKFIKQLREQLSAKEDSGSNIATTYNVTLSAAKIDPMLSRDNSLSEIDEKLHNFDNLNTPNSYNIICIPPTSHIVGHYPYVGSHRNIFFKVSDARNAAGKVTEILREVVVQEDSLKNKYLMMRGSHKLLSDKEMMRSIRSSPGYDITFTLIVNEPHLIDAQWNIRQHINDYLSPFIEKLPVAVNIKSQILSYSGMFVRSHRKSDNTFFCREVDLPHMINPLESKLGSHVSNNIGLEFVVYIPSRSQSPLFIHNRNGDPVDSSSFLSPQWGGLLIYNVPDIPQGTSLPQHVNIDGARVMQVFLTQLRLLLGISSRVDGINAAPLSHGGLHEWELDAFMRSRCVENVANAASTLKSLAQLLAQIKNIVINDEIGNEVQRAVDNIREAYIKLEEGQLTKAFQLSQSALGASEKAFFDPSLLELLYFPEDQKFAIYIPLFLPISIPIVASTYQAVRWFKTRKMAARHEKTD